MSASRFLIDRAVPAYEAFRAIYGAEAHAFLYESLGEAGPSRYSFFGGRPSLIHRSHGAAITIEDTRSGEVLHDDRDLIGSLRAVLRGIEGLDDLMPFASGLVGYLGYDVVRGFERLPAAPPDPEGLPDSIMIAPREIVIVDRREGTTETIFHDGADPRRVEEVREQLLASRESGPFPSLASEDVDLRAHTTRPAFERGVLRILEHIRAGDIFQGVLSQRFEADFPGEPLDLYRALRRTNPAPYMYFLRFDAGHAVLGSSPEILVSLDGRRALTRPLAGTRPRGVDPKADAANGADLLADEKERAEHMMLVDLARNDLGRVCDFGSVRVTREMEVEKHARVMHIVSEVEGRLGDDRDALDLVRAAFPAGTVTGAPKIRAMEILDALEPVKRGLYGGAIGYIDPASRMDLCLAIRTIVYHEGRVLLQAGAGVVADSVPSREYEETRHKARGVVHALQLAQPEKASALA